MGGTLMPTLNAQLWNKDTFDYIDPGEQFVLLGAARMVQLRVQNDSCKVSGRFKSTIPACIAPTFVEDRTSYGPKTGRYKRLLDQIYIIFRGIFFTYP